VLHVYVNRDGSLNICFQTLSKYFFIVNFLFSILDPAYADQNNFYGLLNMAATRASIHVGNITFNDGNIQVEKHLLQDVAASQMRAVVDLLDTYHLSVLFYNGNLDIIVNRPALNCSTLTKYTHATGSVWCTFDCSMD
jgi:hypothetical protein